MQSSVLICDIRIIGSHVTSFRRVQDIVRIQGMGIFGIGADFKKGLLIYPVGIS